MRPGGFRLGRCVRRYGWGTVLALLLLSSGPRVLASGGDVSPLVTAAKAGDAATVRSLLARPGADVNATEHDGTTALHWAVQHGQVDVVKALIRARADVNRKNRYGVAPLWLAATNGDNASVEALLRAGADAQTTRGDSGETVLMIAAMAGSPGVLQRLLAYGADPNAKDNIRGQTALMWAAAEGHPDAARVLVEVGADVEAQSSTGITPLMFAIRAGHIPTTLALLDLGANLQAVAPDGTTNLGLAIINAHWELAAALLDRGADANTSDPRGRPLHLVAHMRTANNRGLSAWLPRRPTGRIGSLDVARQLIARGAAINDRTQYRNGMAAPTHMALAYFTMISWNGVTPLFIASKGCDVEFIQYLLANGADPAINNEQGVTPLLAAAGVGYAKGEAPGTPEQCLEAVKVLAAAGNDIRAVAKLSKGSGFGGMGGGWDGAGALHGAVIRAAGGLVEWLIAQGIPLDVQAAGGRTALDLARGSTLGINYSVQPEIAEIIEKAMRARGLPIPEHKYDSNNEQGGAVAEKRPTP
ncbi:MAG: ankyrin repeat domain-containing protein [Vicinamibacterales bacterium]